jgi:hypothetical protein
VPANPNQAITPLQLPQFKKEDMGHGPNADEALAFFNQFISQLVTKVNAHSKILDEQILSKK